MSDEPNEEKKPASPLTGRSEPNLPPHLREQMQSDAAAAEIARTKLDYAAVESVVSQTTAKKEEQVAEMLLNPASQVIKPANPIVNFKAATPCRARTDSKERVGFCEKCQGRFYDFSDMEMPEAEELIFKMEGLKQFQLFKRADGKFMTKDCVVGKKTRMMRILALGVGAVAVLCLGIVSLMAPQPTINVSAPVSGDDKSGGSGSSESTSISTGGNTDGKSESKEHKPIVIRHYYK
jgi:hypothetical protein